MEEMNKEKEHKRFDVYQQLKQVIKSQHRQCRDPLSSSSVYCFDCQESSCGNCSDDTHLTHSTVHTLPYYLNEGNEIVKEHFALIDRVIAEDKGGINVPQLRMDLTQLIEDKAKEIAMSLDKVKEFKLKEVNALLDNSESSVTALKSSVNRMKESIADFICANNSFMALTLNSEGSSEDTLLVNNDFGNSTFLMRYDLLEAASNQTKAVVGVVNDINASVDKYHKNFLKQADEVNDLLQKMLVPTEESFNYTQLTKNYYAEIEEKLGAYNDLISTLKSSVVDSLNQHHSFDDLDKKIILSEARNKRKLDSVLNTEGNLSPYTTINQQTITLNDGMKKSLTMNRTETSRTHRSNYGKSSRGEKQDLSPEVKQLMTEVSLSQERVQKYFTYQMLEMLTSLHQLKKKSLKERVEAISEDDIEIAKPLPETNEIQVFDRKTLTTEKRKVHFDKSKHQYTYFLNGSRNVLIKDRLYITGGIDKEKKECNLCYVYYIKTNELKPMQEMKNARAYHTIEFLESFKSLIVVGGENNATCELYDMYTSRWKQLPNLSMPRANSSIYLDRLTNAIYVCFGINGCITKADLYSDTMEMIELKRASSGWLRVDYINRSEMDFRNAYCRIFPVDHDKLLVYGASGARNSRKQSAIFLLRSHEMIKIDSNTFNEMRQCAKKSEKMNDIIAKFI